MGPQRCSRPLILILCLCFLAFPANASDPHILQRQAYEAYQQKNYAQAIRFYLELVKLRPADAETRYNLGVVYYFNHAPQQAIEAYQQAIALQPDYFDAYNNLGVVYIELRAWDRAIEVYRYLSQTRADDPDIWYHLGICYSQSNMPEQALSAWRHALSLNPAHVLAREQVSRFEKKQAALSTPTATNTEEAIRLYQSANGLKERGQWQEAVQTYQKALSLDGRLGEAHYQLGSVYYQQGNYHAALAALNQAVVLIPTHISAHHLIALSDERLGKTGQAIEVLLNLLLIHADYLPALYDLGRLYQETGRPEQAIRMFERAGKQDKSYSDVLYRLGKLHLQQGTSDLAAAYFQESVRLKPHFVPALMQLGKMAWQAGQTDSALQYFSQALERAPDNPEMRYTLAGLLFASPEAAHQARALDYLNQALKLRASYLDALVLRGVLHYNAGRYAQAIADLEQSRQQEPQRADIQRNLGLAYARAGQAPAAIKALEACLKLAPDHPDAARIRQAIQALRAGQNRP